MTQETMIKAMTVLVDVYDASDELLELSQKLSGCCVDSDSLVDENHVHLRGHQMVFATVPGRGWD